MTHFDALAADEATAEMNKTYDIDSARLARSLIVSKRHATKSEANFRSVEFDKQVLL